MDVETTLISQQEQQLLAENEALKMKIQKLQATVNPGAVLLNMLSAFRMGQLKGSKCRDASAKLFTPDAVIDSRGPLDTQFFKKFPSGHEGVCEFFTNLYNDNGEFYVMHNLHMETYKVGDKMAHVWHYVPGFYGKDHRMAPERIWQYNVYTLSEDKTRIAAMDVLFDK